MRLTRRTLQYCGGATRRILLPLVALLLAGYAPLEPPEKRPDAAEDCRHGTGGAAATIQACTAAIASGEVKDDDLGLAYYTRGKAFLATRHPELAEADIAAALRISPHIPDLLRASAESASRNRDYPRAILLYGDILRLTPDAAPILQARGIAHDNNGDPAAAITDFSAALKLAPDADLLLDRAIAYGRLEDYPKALADLDEAIGLRPGNAPALRARGRARFNMSDYPAAITDFTAAVEAEPRDAYGVIWLYLVRRRAGEDAAEELDRNAARLDLESWPGPVIAMFQGKLAPEALKSEDARPTLEAMGAVCEAHFYRGEWYLLHGERTAAERAFSAAIDTHVPEYLEDWQARLELRELQR